jgi:hypothetical protein
MGLTFFFLKSFYQFFWFLRNVINYNVNLKCLRNNLRPSLNFLIIQNNYRNTLISRLSDGISWEKCKDDRSTNLGGHEVEAVECGSGVTETVLLRVKTTDCCEERIRDESVVFRVSGSERGFEEEGSFRLNALSIAFHANDNDDCDVWMGGGKFGRSCEGQKRMIGIDILWSRHNQFTFVILGEIEKIVLDMSGLKRGERNCLWRAFNDKLVVICGKLIEEIEPKRMKDELKGIITF